MDDGDEDGVGIVLSLVPRLPTLADDDGEPPALISKPKYSGCWHSQHTAIVSENERTLKCDGCGCDLDPFEFIARMARDGDRLLETRKRYRALVVKLEELMREERRVKARVRRWRNKEGA